MEVGERRQPPGCDNEGTATTGPAVDVTVPILCTCLYSIEMGVCVLLNWRSRRNLYIVILELHLIQDTI
jgi:hypothetical protein